MKKRQLVLRISLSSALLAYIISRLDFAAMKEVMGNFSPLLYAAGFIILLLSQIPHVFLLKSLLGARGGRVKAPDIFRALAVGNFFGMFLPGSAGADIMVAYNLSRASEKKENPVSAAIFARVMILFSSIALAFIFSLRAEGIPGGIKNIYAAVIAVFIITAFITADSRCSAVSARLLSFLKKNRWTHLIYRTYFVISEYGKNKKLMVSILPLAIGTSILRVLVNYTISLALNIEIPAQYFFIFLPLVSIATVLPLSLSGIGVREGTYVGLFALIGVKTAEAFSISIVSFSTGILFALIGAGIYIAKGAAVRHQEE